MKKNNIPKIINYCWFGSNPKPDLINKCIESWRKYCPDYEIKEWNENNFNVRINKYVSEAYDQKKYAFVSDYARLWILYNYGGIYLDTDVELIKNLDSILDYEAFFSSEDNVYINTGLGCGSIKKSKIVKFIMDDYENIHFLKDDGTLDKTTCPVRNTARINKFLNKKVNFEKTNVIDNICFFSKEYFCPLDYHTRTLNLTDKTFAIHWFNGSWMSKIDKLKYYIKRFLKIKK